MLFVMMRSQKLMKMYAGNFFTLSLETFVNVGASIKNLADEGFMTSYFCRFCVLLMHTSLF